VTDYNKAAELLRLTLPIMAEKKVPATPTNYAVFYEYISKTNELLNAELDKLISGTDTISNETCQELFDKQLVAFEVEKLRKMQLGLRTIVDAIHTTLVEAGSEASHYDDILSDISRDLTKEVHPDQLLSIVNLLSEETKQVKNTHSRFITNIENNQQEVVMLRKELEKVKQEVTTDGLTGLLNRKALDKALIEETLNSKQENYPLCMLIIDIDKFKRVNDKYGHLVGDKVIRYVANTIKVNLERNIGVYRFGGEEFCVLLPRVDLSAAASIAEAIRQAQEKGQLVASRSNERIGRVTISIGVANLLPNEQIESFIDRADKALYKAKTEGRNCVVSA